ncbi:MAG: hypothetical protein HKP21_06430 [Xanthomonadales bacterium]|jgi:hypothetical protein|nr:hypothetical protein [Gammaproteobacteria bacterium]MBT8073328.1 hypothetical protein [Gammaproteobacteria bacterium]MBT8075717.1 hypothetical protein [Gammaproteobacteria bacterium]NNK04171.1 hypothetical protein [Xanthomonadales bacterium]NNK97922.1 hypothetical protein [Xanthomonadales bacterium]
MKWLEGNPLGMALVAASGLFILLALVMAVVWTLPVSGEIVATDTDKAAGTDTVLAANEIGSLNEYRVINEKPVFNESRQPVIVDEDDESLEDDGIIEVKDAPDVRLTGVIITPGMRIASLTPADGNLESIRAHEGESLTGEFVGWQVSAVNARTVILESRDGQSLELDLQVHDATIKQPPAPAVPVKTAAEQNSRPSQVAAEDDEPLSRAEQIRQRIAERREELRLEQEGMNAQNTSQADGANQASRPSNYQSAIRALMKNKSKDQGSNDKEDG